jgi:integrase/recombinase XerD
MTDSNDIFRKRARVLSDRDLECVLSAIAQRRYADRNRAAIMLSHLAGMRVGEIANLMLSDVLDAAGCVREHIELHGVPGKHGEARMVPINARLRQELERYVATFNARYDRPLLMTQKRTQFSAKTLCTLLSQLYAIAGIDGASSHSGPRWFISRLALSGVPTTVIMMLAGHKHIETTQRNIEVSDELMRRAVEAL